MKLLPNFSRLKSDAFYRQAAIFLSASLLASVLNYIYYPVMSRLLSVPSYGELQVITSFLLQITTIFVGLNLITVNIIANHDRSEVGSLSMALQKSVFWLVSLLAVILVVVSPELKHFFNFNSVWPFVFIAPTLLIDAMSVFWTGYIQGHRDFKSMSWYTILTAFGKLVITVILIGGLGFGVSGGPIGIGLGLVGGLVAARLITHLNLPGLRQSILWPTAEETKLIKQHLVFILEVIFSLVIMSVLLSIDVMLVKHYFSPDFAGRYAGIATVSRIIFFASAPLVTVMLPTITLRDATGSWQSFKRTLSLSLVVSLVGFIIFWRFPVPFIRLFLGHAFIQSAHWLPQLSVVAILVTLTNIVVNYQLAKRSHWAMIISGVSLVCTVGLIMWHHATVTEIVRSACLGLGVGLVTFLLSLLTTSRANSKARL